jgi:ABC-type glycerol-3-phosphate transport system permease component
VTPRWHRYAFLALALVLVAIVLFPVYWMLVTSLLPSSIVLSRYAVIA